MKAIALALAAIVVFSGCASKGGGLEPVDPSSGGSTVLVEDGDGGTVEVNVSSETGAILGIVRDDAGFGLGGAHAALLGSDLSATTNESGWFRFIDIKPSKYGIRVDHPSYRAAEADVEVREGNVTRLNITLVPREDVGAGYRPHVHDYWGGDTTKVVKDARVPFHVRKSSNAQYAAVQSAQARVFQIVGSQCTIASRNSVGSAVAPIQFDDPHQLVIPGTSSIQVVPSWTSSNFVGDGVHVMWKAPNEGKYNISAKLRSGQTFELPVTAAKWDSGHQQFTLWELYLCLYDREDTGPEGSGKVVVDGIHVRMELVRGYELQPEPPHRDFWSGGSVYEFLNITKSEGCGQLTPRDYSNPAYWVPIPPGMLVAPGTARLEVSLSWKMKGAWPLPVPMSIVVSPADVPPWERWSKEAWILPKAASTAPEARSYRVELDASQTDAFYQAKSNWAFMVRVEGREWEDIHQSCVNSSQDVTLRILAHRE